MRVLEGGHQFTNKLVYASSPYLRQHAHNPVEWYPWGEEALARAKKENKPILISIGYSTCYWCHVMEREVFENPSIAALMNRNFINIKIDREEHPQLDEIYMVARQLMTHEGGWPNNVFLTPDLKPFYAGGTYGATDAYNKPAFPRLLEWLTAQWNTERDKVEASANEMIRLLQQFLVAQPNEPISDISPLIASARADLEKHHDVQSGGFFQQPKFPQENYLQFLLAHHEATGDASSLDMAIYSLRKMAAGGINDQVGCGFHRYAVDRDWMVPHFEKMLYTQALLARTYTDAARITNNPYLADVAKSICEYVAGPFTDGNGAFYSAIDAETDGVEGEYYAWSSDELEKILTPDEIDFFIHHYALADIPHFPGHKHPKGEVVMLRAPLDEAATTQNIPYAQLAGLAGSVLNKLFAVRNMRVAPHLDHKIIVGWNGLMIDALAHAGKIFSKPNYVARAAKAAQYLLSHAISNDGELMRCVTRGQAEHVSGLEDYACLIKGLLSVYEANNDAKMLASAKELLAAAENLFEDKEQGAFFTMKEGGPLPVRAKNGDDGALPSANAIMAENYVTLHRITGDENFKAKAHKLVQYFLSGESRVWLEYTAMLKVALSLQEHIDVDALPAASNVEKLVVMGAHFTSPHEMEVILNIKDGWYIQPDSSRQKDGTATRISIDGAGVRVLEMRFPPLDTFEGRIAIRIMLSMPAGERPPIKLRIRYFPCKEGACYAPMDDILAL